VSAEAEIESLYRTLVDRERFAHAVLDGLEDGIVTADEDGIVTFVNRSASQLLHLVPEGVPYPVEAVLGLPCGPKDILDGEPKRSLSYPLETSQGEMLDLELTVSRGDASVDDRVGFFFIFRDVHEEKRREAERRRFERLAAMGTMVAGFAHEVRNPVAAMRSIAEELAEELRDAGVTMPHVGLMLQMVERIERLVKTSLQFGRPAAPKRAPQSPWAIVSSALVALRGRLGKFDTELRMRVDPDLPDVHVDDKQLAQALVILISNALDATGDPSRVTVRVRRSSPPEPESRPRKSDPPSFPTVRFEIVDDGPGIAPENIGRIFDPFFTTKSTGTGLGLSIAQQIVSENRARLEVASTPGIATTFSVIVAVADAEMESP
ncbi:MAG TPA: ATP-binding protein, partial [Polyangiaceae bacterium]